MKYSSTQFQFIDWLTIIFYFGSPFILIFSIFVGADPFLFLVTHSLKFYPFVRHIWLPGYAKILQIIALPFVAWPLYNLIVYELFRVALFSLSVLVNAGGKMFSILHSLHKKQILCKNVPLLHKTYYSRLQIISQSVEPAIKISMVAVITSLAMVTCTMTLIVVRLHGKFKSGLLLKGFKSKSRVLKRF